MNKILEKTKIAASKLIQIDNKIINEILERLTTNLEKNIEIILKENKKDLELMDIKNPMYDRLLLSKERILNIIKDIKNVIKLNNPVEEILEQKVLKNGLKLKKIRVPFGVVGVIYEARPNVTIDVFTLCLKTQNACVLKGGSDANFSNQILIKIIQDTLKEFKIDINTVILLPKEREYTLEMLKANSYIDVIIPRGSKNLITFVRDNSTVPVIETGAGIVHTYIHKDANILKAKEIIFNAKTRRPSVCNSLDTLIIDKEIINKLNELTFKFISKKVDIFADEISYNELIKFYPQENLYKAKEKHYGTEFLSLKMSLKVVNGIDEAVKHITKYSSKHSEAIISDNEEILNEFCKRIDAAVIFTNASTAFTDGAEFELGAEIGISTQKLHARGPMALAELCSYKWVANGNGEIRN